MSILQVQQRTASGLTNVGQFPQSIVGSMGSAIIESGSNANGNYVKFADGTLICSSPKLTLSNDIINTDISIDFNFATQFADTNMSHSFYSAGTPSGNIMSVGNAYSNGPVIYPNNTISGKFMVYTYRYAQTSLSYWRINSIGRWK